jgi:hypothetical protein
MSTRKPCTNVQTATYSGKEQSPLHFGLSAEGYDLNTIMEGYDKMQWMVKIKNNRKVWVRQMSTMCKKMIHEEPVIPDTNDVVECVIENNAGGQTDIKVDKTDKDDDIENNEADTIKNVPNVPEKTQDIMKPVVQEKKPTDYNMFLTYRLFELKKQNSTKPNKEHFVAAIAEWKELKKNPEALKEVLEAAQNFKKV